MPIHDYGSRPPMSSRWLSAIHSPRRRCSWHRGVTFPCLSSSRTKRPGPTAQRHFVIWSNLISVTADEEPPGGTKPRGVWVGCGSAIARMAGRGVAGDRLRPIASFSPQRSLSFSDTFELVLAGDHLLQKIAR